MTTTRAAPSPVTVAVMAGEYGVAEGKKLEMCCYPAVLPAEGSNDFNATPTVLNVVLNLGAERRAKLQKGPS